jgi:hypothetical protein
MGVPQAGMLSLAVVGLIGAALLQWFKSTSPETVRLPEESTASLGKRPSH